MDVLSKSVLVVFLAGAGLGSIVTFKVTRSTFCEAAKDTATQKDFFDKSKTHIKIGDEQTF